MPPIACTIGEIACSTIGPTVIGSTKWPSPTSKWNTRAPVRRSTSICEPRLAKSAAYNDGSISTVRIHSCQATPRPDGTTRGRTVLGGFGEPRDEEAARRVDMRQREQELRTIRMDELRPFVPERQDAEAARLDHRLVLVRVDRADGVDDRPSGTDALSRRAEERELQLRQRLRAPA